MRYSREIPPERVIIADPDSDMVVDIRRQSRNQRWGIHSPEFKDQADKDFERAIAIGHGRLDAVTGR